MRFIQFLLIPIIALVLAFVFLGCSSTKEISDKKETVVKIHDHVVTPDKIQDISNEGQWSVPDKEPLPPTVIITLDQIHEDPSWIPVKYTAKTKHGTVTFFPHNDSLVTDLQPDQVKYTDTNKTTTEQKVLEKQPGFFEQFGIWIKWCLIILGLLVIIFFGWKFFK